MAVKKTKPKITKESLLAVYDKYPASNWIKFAFKFFSSETEKKDMSLSNTVLYILISLFMVGFIGTIFNAPRKILLVSILSYTILLSILVIYLFSAVLLNNRRIKKIYTELGITRDEYMQLVLKYNI